MSKGKACGVLIGSDKNAKVGVKMLIEIDRQKIVATVTVNNSGAEIRGRHRRYDTRLRHEECFTVDLVTENLKKWVKRARLSRQCNTFGLAYE